MSLPPRRFERIDLHFDPPIAQLSLAHPPVNVIDIVAMEELASALSEVEAHPNCSTLVVRGAGSCFSAGVNIADHTPEKVGEMLQKFHSVVRSIVATKKITIAAVHGNCLGGGAELAMVCDIVITTDDALWGFPEIKLGCFPPIAATALAALIGQKRASELILTGRTITGSQAASMGIATTATPAATLDSAVEETTSHLRALSLKALAMAKKAMYAWGAMHFDKGLARAEKVYLDELMNTEDAQEGIRAFLEKRSPLWRNR
jgi:cyclohexa-1,5-dienecarbonyl-CoA hydratase